MHLREQQFGSAHTDFFEVRQVLCQASLAGVCLCGSSAITRAHLECLTFFLPHVCILLHNSAAYISVVLISGDCHCGYYCAS